MAGSQRPPWHRTHTSTMPVLNAPFSDAGTAHICRSAWFRRRPHLVGRHLCFLDRVVAADGGDR